MWKYYQLAVGIIIITILLVCTILQQEDITLRAQALLSISPPHPEEPVGAQKPLSTWTGNAEREFYCYSAYYDDRKPLRRHEVAVITNIIGQYRYEKVHDLACQMHYPDGTNSSKYDMMQMRGVYEVAHDRGQTAWIIQCQIRDAKAPMPVEVSLYLLNEYTNIHEYMCTVPVQQPRRPPPNIGILSLGLCVPLLYRLSTTACPRCRPRQSFGPELVPWLETQMLLGVQHVTFYNHSMDAATDRVLRYYRDIGFADIVPISSLPGDTYRIPSAISVNDCLYRNIHMYQKMLIIDVDEYIIPRHGLDFVSFMKEYAAKNGTEYNGTQFWFAGTNYYTDYPHPDASQPDRFPLFKYVYHRAPDKFPGSCKPIIDTHVCRLANPHMCVYTFGDLKVWKKGGYVFGIKHGSLIRVNPNDVHMQHYTGCKSSWWKAPGYNCNHIFNNMVYDNHTLVLERRIKERVREIDFFMNVRGY